MKTIFHALEPKILQQFIESKKELLEVASSMTAKERAEGKKEIMESAVLFDVPSDLDDMRELYTVKDSTAIIPIRGKLVAEADICDGFFSDCTTYGFIQEATMAADNDPMVSEIEYHIASGGGHVTGVDVCGQVIAGCGKKTHGVVFGMAASAAYWLASQMDTLRVSAPTDFVGSIGVAVEIVDYRKQEESRGIQRIVLTSTDAPDKRVDYTTEEGQAKEIEELDAIHQVFVSRIATGRNVSIDKINADFGKGGVVIAEQALKAGMIDKIDNAIGAKPQAGTIKKIETETPAAGGKTKTGEVTKMTLKEQLAADPAMKAEYDADIASAKSEGEATGKVVMKTAFAAATPILSSANYPDSVKERVSAKAENGDVEGLKDFVAMFDMGAQGAANTAAVEEQPADTKPEAPTSLKKAENEGLVTGDDVDATAKAMREG